MEQSDPWAMTPDQKAYYLAQFLRLQPNPSGHLSGQTAKSFFELSKLPVSGLSQIWELSDVDADGQLSLSEFSVAMHLVVLHRNGVMLPSQLPESLRLVATSSALSAPPPPPPPPLPPPLSPPSPSTSPPGQSSPPITASDSVDAAVDAMAAAAVERRWRLGEHHSFDSTVLESVHTVCASHRRWSTSSPTDTVSLADGITSFDGRLVPNAQVRHPIAIRANPAPSAARAPTPPPRARTRTATSDSVACSLPLHPPASLTSQRATSTAVTALTTTTSSSQDEAQQPQCRAQQLTETLIPLQKECELIVRENNALTTELVGLQKRRIALEILLERLTPL